MKNRPAEKLLNKAEPDKAIISELERVTDRLDEQIGSFLILKESVEGVSRSVQSIEVPSLPEVQKVFVENQVEFPEQKAPIVNVEPPIVNIPAPIVNVEAPNVEVKPQDIYFPDTIKAEITNFPETEKIEIQKVFLVDEKGKPANLAPIVNIPPPSISPFAYGGQGHDSVKVTSLPAITATDLDIRNLSQTQDSVLIYGSDDGGTTKRVIKTDSGGAVQVDLEVASVTVTNAAGASAVNIQDGGNSITVDGTVTNETVSTATLSNVAGSASSVSLLASNTARKGAYFFNDSTASLYLKFGTTASTSSFTLIMRPNDFYEIPQPVYTGAIDGIWSAANGFVRITEL